MAHDRPGVIAPPPLIFLAGFAVAWAFRGEATEIPHGVVIGAVLALASFALVSWGFLEMRKAKTHVDPYKPTTAIVTTGPYRFSRNPLYIALTLAYLSASIWTGTPEAFLALPVVLVVLQQGVIKREERYLEGKFGDLYRAYKARVRRWV